MSQSIANKTDDPINKLRAQVVALGPELKNALPSHIKLEKFQRVVMTVVQQQPDLLQADRRSLFASCMKCAADGLVPDNREAALVIFNTKKKIDGKDVWVKAVQYMPMMAGVLKRVRNSGEIASVQAHVIYENDQFLIRRGLTDTLEHTPLFPGERGRPIGAYAVAKFKDGSEPQFEVMDLNQIEKVRQVSKSKDGPTWTQHWDEMARKTVFRRLSKWLPMDAETESVVRRDDEIGTIDASTPAIDAVVGDDRQKVSSANKLDALEHSIEYTDAESVPIDERVTLSDDPPAPGAAAADLITAIEATEDSAALEDLLNQQAVRATVRKLNEADASAVEIATQAQRRLWAGPSA